MPRNKNKATRHKSAAGRVRAPGKAKASVKAKSAKLAKTSVSAHTSLTTVGKSRAEGIRLFALAGRPSKEDFVKVYGPAGPKMTWEQRAKAGVPAEKFQAALASAMRQAK